MLKNILYLFISGIALGSGPCLVTCGPVLVSYIAGTRKGSREGFWVWLSFSLARICMYLILSVAIFFVGEFLLKQLLAEINKYILIGAGVIICLIGILVFLKDVKIPLNICAFVSKNFEQRLSKAQPAVLGAVIGLLPCAPLLAVLSYIGLISFSWQRCVIYSLSFGLGTLISPLILLAMAAGLIPKLLLSKPRLQQMFRIICGSIIMIYGLQLILRVL